MQFSPGYLTFDILTLESCHVMPLE